MKLSRYAMALCAAISLGASNAFAAIGTNFSDQWWNPNESGWGASLLQQGDIIFVDLFVYGPDNKPVWYTAIETFQGTNGQGHTLYGGDLYVTNGPYFGAGAFNPANVTFRKVGTMTFDFDTVDTGTLSYSVDGTARTVLVTRQTWKYEGFTGDYYGGMILDYTGCTNPANNGHVENLGVLNIDHGFDNAVTMASEARGYTCNYFGGYSQAGHMGTVQGSYNCTSGEVGSFTAFEMEKTASGMTGRMLGQNGSCNFSGRFGGISR